MLRSILANCNNCDEMCENEKKIICFKEDETCKFLMDEKCKHMCLMKFCDEYKKKKDKRKKERKLIDLSVVGDKLQIILSRAKAH